MKRSQESCDPEVILTELFLGKFNSGFSVEGRSVVFKYSLVIDSGFCLITTVVPEVTSPQDGSCKNAL